MSSCGFAQSLSVSAFGGGGGSLFFHNSRIAEEPFLGASYGGGLALDWQGKPHWGVGIRSLGQRISSQIPYQDNVRYRERGTDSLSAQLWLNLLMLRYRFRENGWTPYVQLGLGSSYQQGFSAVLLPSQQSVVALEAYRRAERWQWLLQWGLGIQVEPTPKSVIWLEAQLNNWQSGWNYLPELIGLSEQESRVDVQPVSIGLFLGLGRKW